MKNRKHMGLQSKSSQLFNEIFFQKDFLSRENYGDCYMTMIVADIKIRCTEKRKNRKYMANI